jgi:hypothetical protein
VKPCDFSLQLPSASLKRTSLNQKGSKVAKKTPPTKKKKQPSLKQVLSTGVENTDPDATPDLKDLIKKEKELIVERPKRRRRVHFKSSSGFEKKKPTLVLTSVQPE